MLGFKGAHKFLRNIPRYSFAKRVRIEFPKLDIGVIPEELKYDRNCSNKLITQKFQLWRMGSEF